MFRRSDEYEREFIHEALAVLPKGWLGQRGTHTEGVDVLLFKNLDGNRCISVRVEVKTFNGVSFSLSRTKEHMEQYSEYLGIKRKYRIMTYYAFRTKGQNNEWKVFPINKIPKTRNGMPKLDIRKGMTLKEFAEAIA
jgi:hypothetical protein